MTIYSFMVSKKEITRNAILAAAKNSFIEKGFIDTQIIEIAKEVEVDRRTVYRHFENKELILLNILADYYHKFIEHIEQVDFATEVSAYAKLEQLINEYFSFFIDKPEMLLFVGMVDKNLSIATRETEVYQQFIAMSQKPDQLMVKFLQEGSVDKSLDQNLNVELTAVTINNAFLALANRIVTTGNYLSQEQGLKSDNMLDELKRMILKGIKNDDI